MFAATELCGRALDHQPVDTPPVVVSDALKPRHELCLVYTFKGSSERSTAPWFRMAPLSFASTAAALWKREGDR